MDRTVLEPGDWNAAVADADGPQVVVAGPGTGKSEFLVQRTVHLLENGLADPGQIVVLTFSRRAASDLRARVADRLGSPASGVDISTFHSFAHRMLETHSDGEMGTLLTGPEQIRIVSDLLGSENQTDWPVTFRTLLGSQTFAEEVSDFLLRCQERLISPRRLTELAGERADWKALPGFFNRYDRHLRATGRLDYGTLLVDAISMLADQALSESLGELYRFVLVDEYQDTSPAQAELVATLTARHRNITVAGDPYQSIYSFRGADLTNLARFPDRFTDLDGHPARRIVLGRSHRVPAPVMDAALRVVRRGGLPGSAGPVAPAAHRGRVDAFVFDQQSAEAEWIASEVERLVVEERLALGRIGVLVRSKRRLLPELSRALERRKIVHDKPDSRLVDHPAVRIVLDLTRAAALSALDATIFPGVTDELDRTMRRLLLGPLFALPIMTERDLVREQRRTACSWPDILRSRLSASHGVPELLEDTTWATESSAADGFWKVWTTVGAFSELVGDPDRSDDRRALSSFSQALGRQADRDPTLTLLSYLRLAEEDDFEATPLLSSHSLDDRIVLTTLHQAKGLEFDVVFIADATEGVFPDTRRTRALLQPQLLSSDVGAGDTDIGFRLQEEMRLAYTAMTRARQRVIWTATAAGIDEGGSRPSRFLLAAAGVDSAADLTPPPDRSDTPVSVIEAETLLRRTMIDPDQPAARRLAATTVLARPPTGAPWAAAEFAGVAEPGPDTGVVGRPLRLSPSQAEAYEACPRQYVFDRRLRLSEPMSPYLTFGSLIHGVLERVERQAMPDRRRSTIHEALGVLDNLMSTADFGSGVLAAAWRRRAGGLLERLYRDWPTDSREVVLIEHPLSLEIDGATWIGRADRIERTADGTLRIIDYKTGATVPTKAAAAASLQLGYYLLAARSDPEVVRLGRPAGAEFWFPLASRVGWRLAFDPAQLDTVTDRLVAAGRGIASEDWTPRVGTPCKRCPVRLVCDRWPEGREAFVE